MGGVDQTLATIGVDALVVSAWSVAVAVAGSRLPAHVLATDGPAIRLRRWEREGRVYERVGIKRWKDHLPDAGATFGGGDKRRLPGADRRALDAFAVETRRAEIVHWVSAAVVVTFPLWNPPHLALLAAVVWLLANLPCIAAQRYNRARVERIMALASRSAN
jgi:glycosyl-4,4'-diaponeurosporenoate acyltransferase